VIYLLEKIMKSKKLNYQFLGLGTHQEINILLVKTNNYYQKANSKD